MREKTNAWVQVGILPLMKIIGQHYKQKKQFFHKILLPYLHTQISHLGLQKN